MKSIWQGSLSFGLVNIPITLYSAVESQVIGFTLLCDKCHNPISYKRWCEHCNKEVAWDHVVKGLKLKKDTYFVLTKENLQKLKPLKTDSIAISEFIDPIHINPIYFDKHYYIAPTKNGEKAYFLFVAALNKADKVAVGSFVMKEKEHICVISPYQNALLLTTLNYAYEIKPFSFLEKIKTVPKISADELKLALQVIEQRTKNKFDIHQFRDTFAQRLIAVIKKSKGKRNVILKEKQKKTLPTKTLLESLKASLKKTPQSRSKTTKKK